MRYYGGGDDDGKGNTDTTILAHAASHCLSSFFFHFVYQHRERRERLRVAGMTVPRSLPPPRLSLALHSRPHPSLDPHFPLSFPPSLSSPACLSFSSNEQHHLSSMQPSEPLASPTLPLSRQLETFLSLHHASPCSSTAGEASVPREQSTIESLPPELIEAIGKAVCRLTPAGPPAEIPHLLVLRRVQSVLCALLE